MTTMAKKETVQRKWYVLDAAGKPLGRTAVTAAKLLRGKHKVDFTPNVDCGDFGRRCLRGVCPLSAFLLVPTEYFRIFPGYYNIAGNSNILRKEEHYAYF